MGGLLVKQTELDDLDEYFLSQSHPIEVWRRELKDALIRCAYYCTQISKLQEENRELRSQLRQENDI